MVLAFLAMLAFGCTGSGTLATPAPTIPAPTPQIVGPTATVTTGPVSLAFATTRGVYVAAADGTGGRELTIDVCLPQRGGVVDLDLSPDGHHLAFACYNTEGESFGARLYLLDLTSGSRQCIADGVGDGRSMAWSPDGRYLAYFVYRNIGPAAVSAYEIWAYELATNRHVRLNEPRYFLGPLVWEPDGSAVVYLHGSWQQTVGPVDTYRAPLDGSGGVVWRRDVQVLLPGPDGQWLGSREPRDREGAGVAMLIDADGKVTPVSSSPHSLERPLGWLGSDPVVWRRTEGPTTPVSDVPGGVWWLPAPGSTLPRGEVWLAGSVPRRLLANVPIVGADNGTAALAGNRLLYVDQWQGNSVWLADLSTGQVSRLPVDGKGPVALHAGS